MNRTAALSPGSLSSRTLPALLFVLLLGLVAQTVGRPSSEDESDYAIIPPDADNVEIHKVKIVNGVMQKDHPVIMYKEDFVSEDYDPTKSETATDQHKKHKRTHHHHAQQRPDKEEDQILFDILPDKPIVLAEDLKGLPASKVKAEQLAEPVPNKEVYLGKHPKKYHSRQRRQAYYKINGNEEVIKFHYRVPYKEVSPLIYTPIYYPVWNKKPHLTGNQQKDNTPTPIFIGTRGDLDLLHTSDPEQADYSIYNQTTTTTPRPQFVRDDREPEREQQRRPSFLPRPPPTRRPQVGLPTLAPNRRPSNQSPQSDSEPKVSKCVWAIFNCCSDESKKVRYNCFEDYGCHGAFWDVNPCADDSVMQAELAPLAGFSVPGFAAPLPPRRPSTRKDAFQFPQEQGYKQDSSCQRASKVCCSQRSLGSQYDCFHHHGCQESISTIISTCS